MNVTRSIRLIAYAGLVVAACLLGISLARAVESNLRQLAEGLTKTSNSADTEAIQTQDYEFKRSHGVYPKPPLPPLPKAGGKFTDPVFGTEIMRATDEHDGPAPGFGTYYSHWPTFNCNNTKLLIRKGFNAEAIIKDFDSVNFRIGSS